MKWIPFFILAYIALGLQVGLRGYVEYHHAPPQLMLLAVVFIAINAPREEAMLGSFILGLMQDLLSRQPLGTCALAYGVVGLLLVGIREVVYREHVLAHFFFTLMGGVAGGLVLFLHGWLYRELHPLAQRPGLPSLAAIHLSLGGLLLSALYTAILAPFLLWPLQRMRRFFGFRSQRRRMRL